MPTSAVTLRPRDRVRVTVAISSPAGGCDLLELGNGWLVRAFCSGANVRVGVSKDAGVTWLDRTVAANALAGVSAPALAADRWDSIWVAYHNDDSLNTTYLYRSDDLGVTWSLLFSIDGRTYSRPVSLPERLLLVTHVSGLATVSIISSEDGGDTFGASIASVWTDAEEARCDLRADRRGLLHACYQLTDESLVHRWSGDLGETWSAEVTLVASGVKAAYAIGSERALLTYFVGETLHVATTDETGAAFEEAAEDPAASYVVQQLGVLWDRRGDAFLLGLAGGAAEIVWSGNVYQGWSNPV